MTALHTYNGYKLTVRDFDFTDETQKPEVAVFDPRDKRGPALYKTTSLDKAMKWVDAYQEGQHWAVEAALRRPLLADTKPPARTKAARKAYKTLHGEA